MEKLVELLKKQAEALLDPDNELLIAAEEAGEEELKLVAGGLIRAAEQLNKAADDLMKKSDTIDTSGLSLVASNLVQTLDSSSLDVIAKIATVCDNSKNIQLHKVASVLDEILLTIGAPPGAVNSLKQAEEKEINELRKKYRSEKLEEVYTSAKKEHDKQNNRDEAVKAIDEKIKTYRPMEHALSTRYSPDMPGVSLIRIGDGVYQCPITKRIYNYDAGYTTMDGNKVPGTTVSNQTHQVGDRAPEHMNFSTRSEILNGS